MSAMFASLRERRPGSPPSVPAACAKRRQRCVPPIVFIVFPAIILTTTLVGMSFGHHKLAPFWDFRVFWVAGHAVLRGHSPYPPAEPALLAHEHAFVYPAPAAMRSCPSPASLYGFGVDLHAARDRLDSRRITHRRRTRLPLLRIALLSTPFANAMGTGAISLLLLLGVLSSGDTAIVPRSPPIVAAVVMFKLFLWPLPAWLLFTRRIRAAALASALTAAVTLGPGQSSGSPAFARTPTSSCPHRAPSKPRATRSARSASRSMPQEVARICCRGSSAPRCSFLLPPAAASPEPMPGPSS